VRALNNVAKLVLLGGLLGGAWLWAKNRQTETSSQETDDLAAAPEAPAGPPPSQNPLELPDALVDLWEKCIDPLNVQACSVEELHRARDLTMTEIANTSDAGALATLREMLRVLNGIARAAYPNEFPTVNTLSTNRSSFVSGVGHKSTGACCASCARGGTCEDDCPDKSLEAQPATGA